MTTVKIAYRDDIRRMTVNDFASLLVNINSVYRLENFVLKYQDEDNDWVSVSSGEEFDEAVKATNGKKLLKFSVVPLSLEENKQPLVESNDDEKSHGSDNNNVYTPSAQAKAPLQEKLLYPSFVDPSPLPSVPSPVPSAPPLDPLDHGAACQNCRVRIVGTLYQCTVCPNVSICAACEEHNVHDSSHALMKVRSPASTFNKAQRAEHGRRGGKWKCHKLAKIQRFALPIIFVAVLRHLPFVLCLLALWAGFRFMQKRRALLKTCSECTHNEKCRVGKKAKYMAKGGNGCGLIPKILFAMTCLLVRALPIWLLAALVPLMMCVRSKVRRLKKGACMNNFRGSMGAMCERYKDILQLSWPQLMHRVQQNQIPRGGLPQSMMGCAAVAASESLAASVAAVVALSESVAAELGVTIPVAVPVSAIPYAQQIRLLKEMGFEDSPALQQLLVKHAGDLQAVISEVMQLKPKCN